MGFLKKLKKRGDHAARLAKRKEERRTEIGRASCRERV